MTDKELRRLSRSELLEMLIAQMNSQSSSLAGMMGGY